MKLLPWIKDDIAVEIIGKMIAEQMKQIYKLIADYERQGYSHDSQEVMSDAEHQQLMTCIGELETEIDQIYAGERLEDLYKKVDEVYAPHLKKQHTEGKKVTGIIKSFDETKGFGFIKLGDSGNNNLVNSSDLVDESDKDEYHSLQLEPTVQLNNKH